MPKLQGRSYRLIVLALIVPSLLLIIPAILTYRAEQNLSQSFRWVSHTQQVQNAIERLQRLLMDAESGQRGFLLTGDAAYLEPYMAAMEDWGREFAALTHLIKDNPAQQRNLGLLTAQLDQRLAVMRETVTLEETGRHQDALALVMTGRGLESMKAIRGTLQQMRAEEERLLAERQERLAWHAHFASGVTLAVLGSVALFAVVVFLLLRRIQRLQGLVTMCAWSRTVEYKGEWISFEEYLLRRFNLNTSHGISPAEAEKAMQTFRPPAVDEEDDLRTA